MPSKTIRILFFISIVITANCNFVQNLLPSPTPTVTPVPTATATPVPSPTLASTSTPMELSLIASDLVGTHWTIVYDLESEGHREYELIFYENGQLGNTHPNDQTPDNDFWEVVDNEIIFTFNDKFVTYTGTLTDPDTLSGTAINVNGLFWEWTATRIPG